jgi:hypothetical protein
MASTRMAMANGRLHRAFLEKSGIRFGALEREHERLRCSHPVAHCRASALSLVPVPGRRDAGQAIAATGSVFRTIARQDSVLYSGRRWTDVFRRRAQYIFGASGVLGATWRSGYATVCKTVYPGSIPGVASSLYFNGLAHISKGHFWRKFSAWGPTGDPRGQCGRAQAAGKGRPRAANTGAASRLRARRR